VVGVPVNFKIQSLGINHIALKDLEVGDGIRASHVVATFYPDVLLLKRRLESVRATDVYVNVPEVIRDFTRPGKGKPSKVRKGQATFPPFEVGQINVFNLNVIPADSVDVRVKSVGFSYSMGGHSLRLSRADVRSFKINVLPDLEVDSAFGDMVMRKDTLYLRLSARGRYDTLPLALGDGRMALWTDRDTVVMGYDVGSFEVGGSAVDLKVVGASAEWRLRRTPGRVAFSVRNLYWQDTLEIRDLSGSLVLDSLPNLALEGVKGEVYGGRFRFNLQAESLRTFRGDVEVRGISPGGIFTVSGYTVFSVDLWDTSFIGGGRLDYLRLRVPSMEIGGVDFSVESRGLRRYDFNLLGQFVDVSGYYDVPKDEGMLTFNVEKPLRGISYDRFRLYTFSASGKVEKRRNLVRANFSDLRLWYAVYDTIRIDSVFARDLTLEVNLNDPGDTRSSGEVAVYYSQMDPAVVNMRYSYSPENFYLKGDIRTGSYGRLEVAASGRLPDSVLLHRIKYTHRTVDVSLENITFLYRDTVLLNVPENGLFGGRISGKIGLAKDSTDYRFLDYSELTLENVNPTPIVGTFFPELDVLVDALDLHVKPVGTLSEAEATGRIGVRAFSYGDVQIDSVRSEFRVGRDVIGVNDSYVWIEDSPIEIEVGRYYLPNRTLYVFARTENFPTDRFVPFLLPDSSRLTFELSVSGRVDSPKVLGFLFWTAKGIDLNGNFVKDPKVYAVAEGDRILFPSLKDTNVARLGRGTIHFNGSVGTDLRIDSFSVNLEGAEIQADPDITAVINGSLDITGDLKREVTVTGELTADEVEIFKPLTEMAAGGTSSSPTKPVILYDIRFFAPRRIFLNSTLSSQALTGVLLEIDAELSADLNVQKLSPTLSSISGTLSFLRGNVYIVDKVFRIDRGEIVLYGTGGTVNILSSASFPRITGGGTPDSVKVFVSIEGEIDRPTVRIWSQPYMATGDILALIVGGSNVLGFISRGLKWGLNLTELSIHQTPTSYHLLFGTYITRRIYLKSTLSTAGDYNSVRTLYFVNPNFSIYGERIQEPEGTRYGVGVNFRIRF